MNRLIDIINTDGIPNTLGELSPIKSNSMNSNNYRKVLLAAYYDQELTAEDFDNTLMHFAELYHKEQSKSPKACNNCGCPEPQKTYSGHWCKVCHNEMN